MAKRFTDTEKYRKPFLRGLQGAYKLLWDFLYHDCNHAGIWIKDFEIAQIYIGNDMPINEEDALKYFNKKKTRVIPFSNNEKWFIPSFVDFQYGILNESNRAHNSVIILLKKNKLLKIYKDHVRALQGCKDKDKDKDKDMDKVIDMLEKINIHKSVKKDIEVMLKKYGVDETIKIVERFEIYQKEFIARGWDTQFRYAKRWNKLFENLSEFETQEALNRKFEEIAKRDNERKKRRIKSPGPTDVPTKASEYDAMIREGKKSGLIADYVDGE